MKMKQALYLGAAVAALALAATAPTELRAQQSPAVVIDGDDIGGVVTGPNGPEAGVWVIAESNDLGTKFAKMVVTDDQGRYVIPDLPSANYTLWVRGYGLVDSPKETSTPGKLVNLTATPAPTPAAAAEYYPGMYWYSLLKIPAENEFPGTGPKGNGIPAFMKTQGSWIDTVKNSCQSCHAVGSKGIRTLSPKLGTFKNSREAWERRIQSGQAMTNMAISVARLGPDKGIELYADWTDRIAAGELPASKPERPKGVERNVVITMWDWGTKGMYLHDAIASEKYNQHVNANGPIYGSPEESSDLVPVIDPVKNTFSTIKHPYLDPQTPSTKTNTAGPSVYWGDDPIWDSHTSIHNPMIDESGRVWFTAKIRPDENPEFCKKGSDFPSAKVAPLENSQRQLSMYDPKTQKWSLINTCFSTQHLNFAHDANHTLWTSAGGPASGVVGWLNTKEYLATGDDKKTQGWTPIIVDTNGDGKRERLCRGQPTARSGQGQASDGRLLRRAAEPDRRHRVGPVDGRRLLAARSAGLHHPPHPGREPELRRRSPSCSCRPTRATDRAASTSPATAWCGRCSRAATWRASTARSARRRSRAPRPITGKMCPEGWTLYKFPGPQFKGVTDKGSAEHAYYIWVDRENTLGLGKDVPIASTNGGESLTAIVDGKFVTLRMPYPLGFFSKNVDGRIDDPNAGWKGKGIWTTFGSRAPFHNEGGVQNSPKLYKVQMRPDPLAN